MRQTSIHAGRVAKACLVAVAAALSLALSGAAYAQATSMRQSAQRSLEAAKDTLSESKKTSEEKATAASSEASGLDSDRVSKDEARIDSILSTAADWNDGDSYNKAREDAIELGVPEGSQMLTSFMPKADTLTDQTTGRQYTYVDQLGLNSSYVSSDTTVTGDDGSTYRYVSLLTTSSKADADAVAGTTHYLVLVDMGPNQAVLSISVSLVGSDVDGG